MNGFAVDLTQTSTVWCKLRPFFVQYLALISFNIICFASIDQYLSTSHQPFLRQKSTIRLAKLLTIIASIVWFLHSIPVFFFYEIQSTYGCNIYNQDFLDYFAYFYYLILSGVLPILVSGFFSILAYKNVRRIVRRNMAVRRRKLDQQLTAMILLRVGLLVVMIIPYVAERIYKLTTFNKQDNTNTSNAQKLAEAISFSLFYTNFAGSFYLFLVSSARFRRQIKNAFVHNFWRVYCKKQVRQNQVATLTQSAHTEVDLPSME